jgi:DNA sulfur modification protein DndD
MAIGPGLDAPIIHDLSGEQERQIQGWAATCLSSLPKDIVAIGEQLEDLYRERQKVERDIERIPHDEVLKPLLDRLQEGRERFTKKAEQVAESRTALDLLDQKLQKSETEYRRSADRVVSASSQRLALERAEKTQAVLRDFKDALIEQKVRAVEQEITLCFGLLSRKKFKRVFEIDVASFAVSLRDEQGRSVAKSELSAGEKQIYAIAVLWALGRVAKSPVPIIIDTPLARLDSEHRNLLIEHYFPLVSHQVIILSTDTEIDEKSMRALEPSIAKSFELDFDSSEQATSVKSGYFSMEGQDESR